jgi:ERCC4-related helicase
MKKKIKQINLNLVGLDGNAFNLLGKFRQQAKKEGWTEEEIKKVLDKAKSGDYNNLVCTLDEYCTGKNDEDSDD